jgi:hypothetical protein
MDRLFIVGASRMWSQRNTDSPLGRVYAFVKAKVDGKHFSILNAPVGSDMGTPNA